ncbi:related to MRPL51-mitochondrial ribosomal protein, large subunit [Sporisorium reilianum SRZ2]|uniref:Large ribosomal subunit protein mL43 n=1 Tax=Sporisorium reilianum (strain SRZ2) TaxID=999809 RepID=E7A254_SPORE|nr:related to MRPL51-mitochondrial ribosomal protein, large subunit [Sporisorium reilianum SRZ2]
MSYLKRFTRILRGSLSTAPSTPSTSGAVGAFHLPLRKLVVRYSQHNASSSGTRAFLLSPRFAALAHTYPSVEFVVDRAARDKHPLATGFYAATEKAGRRKDVSLANLDANQVEAKVRLVVESSGARVKSLKRRSVESKVEGARGVWSQLHDKPVDV